jgi:polyhydroxybutyrate depolymerase
LSKIFIFAQTQKVTTFHGKINLTSFFFMKLIKWAFLLMVWLVGLPVVSAAIILVPRPNRSQNPAEVSATVSQGIASSDVPLVLAASIPPQENVVRTYHLHIPPTYSPETPTPIIFAFHALGDSFFMEDYSSLDVVADLAGMIVVYPDAINGVWKDGRGVCSDMPDDVLFVEMLLTQLENHFNIDQRRIFATGFSNGGIFVHFLAQQLSSRFAAIASIGGEMSEPAFANFERETDPISVLMIHGVQDPLVPVLGGNVFLPYPCNQGRHMGVFNTAGYWVYHNAEDPNQIPPPLQQILPDLVPQDQSLGYFWTYGGGRCGTATQIGLLFGAGHTWPGAKPYCHPEIIGGTNFDCHGALLVIEFFLQYPKCDPGGQ